MKIDFPKAPRRKPTKKESNLFKAWIKYLSNSRLSTGEIYSRAASYASRGDKVPK